MLPSSEGSKNYIKHLIVQPISLLLFVPFLLIVLVTLIPSRFSRKSRIKKGLKPRVLFGLSPIINIKYWSNALKKSGYESKTVIWELPAINTKEDYDKILLRNQSGFWKLLLTQYLSYLESLNFFCNFDILQTAYKYSLLDLTPVWRLEGLLHFLYGTKSILHPYGSDAYVYRYITYPPLRHVLNASFKKLILQEKKISKRIRYWERWADFLTTGVMFDGFSRWDALPQSLLLFERKEEVLPLKHYSDGKNSPIKIVHSPNFRGFKGSEFIIAAIDSLKEEGLNIEFTLIEGKKNWEVLEMLKTADILVEQIICPGYGLNAVEGLSHDCVVISNTAKNDYLQVMSIFSFLQECPIVEATPITVKETLRKLITDPTLRKNIASKGSEYVKNHHSVKSYSDFNEAIFDKVWFNKKTDLHFYFTDFKRFTKNHQDKDFS